jgi:hypothetical protein
VYAFGTVILFSAIGFMAGLQIAESMIAVARRIEARYRR